MQFSSRKLVDRSFTGLGLASIALLTLALVVLLIPIVVRGFRAFVFAGTVEHRRLLEEQFGRGDRDAVREEVNRAAEARAPVYEMIAAFDREIEAADFATARKYASPLSELKVHVRSLLGPFPGEPRPVLMRHQYGQNRWDRALVKLEHVLNVETYDHSNPEEMGRKVLVPRSEDFAGTSLEALFPYIQQNLREMLAPRWTFYWGFFLDKSYDAHFFGGIWPELLGTFYLTIGARS
ncbi:MAG: phosphate ABC transporter, permease protein PstA, partial [Planctomycetes bacterium]|nr:phosphate ABC transporter, permease protein PstA [Planctomycetota bacterium]